MFFLVSATTCVLGAFSAAAQDPNDVADFPAVSSAAPPDAYPWQLTDIYGQLSTALLARIISSTEDDNRYKIGSTQWQADTKGTNLLFRSVKAGFGMLTTPNEYPNWLSVKETYTSPSGKWYDLRSYSLEDLSDESLTDLSALTFRGVSDWNDSKQHIKSVTSGRNFKSTNNGICDTGDATQLFASDQSGWDLKFTIKTHGSGQRAVSYLVDEDDHMPYVSIWGAVCGAGNQLTLNNEFDIYRVTQKLEQADPRFEQKAYFSFEGFNSNCDTSGIYCGVINSAERTTDRFGRPSNALKTSSLYGGQFQLPTNLLTDLKGLAFTVAFWARVPFDGSNPDFLRQDDIFDSLLYGVTRDTAGNPQNSLGLSMSHVYKTLAFNRSKDGVVPFDWKLWLTPEFNVRDKSIEKENHWVFLVFAVDRHRTTLYTYDPQNMTGDWNVRYMHKDYILMENRPFSDIIEWGFGVPSSNIQNKKAVTSFDAIDDVFVLHGDISANESAVRSLINTTLVGDNFKD